MEGNGSARRPTVEVEIVSPDIGIATLCGEHDLGSKAELAEALARASEHRCLLVDLGECTFLDSTVLALLVATCQRMWEQDRRLELVIPDDASAIRRVITIAGLTTFLTIHEFRAAAIAGMQQRMTRAPRRGDLAGRLR
jgi:anti-anti-sigma factor